MDFPDLSLVQFSPRDFSGPGVEFFSLDTDLTANLQVVTFTVANTETNPERLYMLRWAGSLVPDAVVSPRTFRWEILTQSLQSRMLWGSTPGYNLTAGFRWNDVTNWVIVPGGLRHDLYAEFSAAGANNTIYGTLYGYSFPKGNVLGPR